MGLEAKLISEGSKKPENGVGDTPLYRIFHEEIPDEVRVLAKLESGEPTGSVKDRAAKRIIEDILGNNGHIIVGSGGVYAVKKLEYAKGLTILDSSSGNYGVSLAHYCKRNNLPLLLVVPGNIPPGLLQKIIEYDVEVLITKWSEGYHGALNRTRELAAKDPSFLYADPSLLSVVPGDIPIAQLQKMLIHDAEIFVTKASESDDGALNRTRELAAKGLSFLYVNQYDNLGNLNAHHDGTGREIWEQTNGEVTHFVAGVGTGGTLIGATRYLKNQDSSIRVYSVHPDSDFPGIQGLQPRVNGEVHSNIFMANKSLVNGSFAIPTNEAVRYWNGLVNAGLKVGISSGANLAAVIRLIEGENITKGTIVTVFPDNLDRYVSMFRQRNL